MPKKVGLIEVTKEVECHQQSSRSLVHLRIDLKLQISQGKMNYLRFASGEGTNGFAGFTGLTVLRGFKPFIAPVGSIGFIWLIELAFRAFIWFIKFPI